MCGGTLFFPLVLQWGKRVWGTLFVPFIQWGERVWGTLFIPFVRWGKKCGVHSLIPSYDGEKECGVHSFILFIQWGERECVCGGGGALLPVDTYCFAVIFDHFKVLVVLLS